jgi:Nif-specific regulatory protein
MIEDLGSRNGTVVNGTPVKSPVLLTDPSNIELAGFTITFSNQINVALQSTATATPRSGQQTDDQLTSEFDPAAITDQRSESRYLNPMDRPDTSHPSQPESASRSQTSRSLLDLAFSLARAGNFDAIVERTLDAIDGHLQTNTVGIYAIREGQKPSKSNQENVPIDALQIPLVGTRQHGDRSYRRAPDSLVQIVSADQGQATLARNVLGDSNLATENSRGEIDVHSLILAPARTSSGKLVGLIHVTTTQAQPPMSSEDLEFVVAVAQILAESLRGIHEQSNLSTSLHRSRKRVEVLQEQVGDKYRMVGRSQAIREVAEKIKLAAPTGATVLIRGESGVGKELVAGALHHASDRRDGPLVCLNCAALSPTLLESELFGHEKGAFTGATDQKTGKFEAADSGTLMLDEIGEMDANIQAKFLRVLEGHAYERVGGNQAIKVDVRVVAATNRDLQSMVADGTFRQDLFYRLNVVEIVVPPLRQRPDDVMMLAEFFLNRYKKETGRKISGFTRAAANQLSAHTWPGNVRELKNAIERAVVLNTTGLIDAQHLMLTTTPPPAPPIATHPHSAESHSDKAPADTANAVPMTIAEMERRHVEQVLRQTEGNKSQAAKILGIERSTLDRKLKKWK